MADRKRMQSVTLENVRIVFRNFSGKEGKYNAEGRRNFCALITDEIAEAMISDGWNIHYLKPRDEDEEPQPYIQVSVGYNARPPRIVMITSRGKTALDEDMVSILDWAEIVNVDLIIRPYQWDVNGNSGVKAYAQSVFITIMEDELERKYIDVPDSAASAMHGHEDDD